MRIGSHNHPSNACIRTDTSMPPVVQDATTTHKESDIHGRIVEHAVDLFTASQIRFTLKATRYVRLSAAV